MSSIAHDVLELNSGVSGVGCSSSYTDVGSRGGALPKLPTSSRVGGAAPLGIYTVLQSPADTEKASKTRVERYILQSAARELLPGERVGVCRRLLVPGKGAVEVWHNGAAGKAHYKNLVVCGALWVCPVCAAKISEHRREELKNAVAASGYSFTLGTITVQHKHGESLASILRVLREAWTKTKAGKGWQVIKDRFKFVGYITALEVTHGKNGWHPHLHVLFVSRSKLADVDREELQMIISARFGRYVAELGGYVSEYHGVDVSGQEAVGQYVAKWGLAEELTKASSKRGRADVGRNPFDLLRDYVKGDKQAGELFKEYAAAMKGRRQLDYSVGLRDLLNIGKELTDQEAAEEQVSSGDILLAKIPLEGWRVILANELRGQLLEVASTGSVEKLREWLLDYGIDVRLPVEW